MCMVAWSMSVTIHIIDITFALLSYEFVLELSLIASGRSPGASWIVWLRIIYIMFYLWRLPVSSMWLLVRYRYINCLNLGPQSVNVHCFDMATITDNISSRTLH